MQKFIIEKITGIAFTDGSVSIFSEIDGPSESEA